MEGAEGCDPSVKNNDLGDGCSPNCTVEPVCPAAGGGCVSRCGDGLTLGAEQCDDGNAVSGDGCSSTCQIETGYLCVPAPIGSTLIVPMVVRDFNAGGDFEKGGAFARDLNLPNQGLLKNLLDSNGLKPVLASATGTYNGMSGTDSGIASPASFAQWYSDTATGPNAYNKTLSTTLNLYQVEGSNPTTYANRFGNNGDGLTSAQYRRVTQELCSLVGREDHDASGNALPCTSCFDNSIVPCSVPVATACQTNPGFIECVKSAGGSNWMGVFLQATFDGNPLWFPADRLMPASPAAVAQVAGNYDESWPEDPTGKLHNFAFTTEIRFWFRYDSLRQYRLGVSNDDDLWVFVNKRLAVDIGGIHTPVEGELTFGNGATSVRVSNTLPSGYNNRISSTPDLGLLDGNVYEVAVFQAQRQTKASSFKLSLSGFDTTRSACRPN